MAQDNDRGGFLERSFGQQGITPSGWLILLLVLLLVGLGVVTFRFPETSPAVVLKTFFGGEDVPAVSVETPNPQDFVEQSTERERLEAANGHYVYIVRYSGVHFSPDILVVDSGDSVRFVNDSNLTMRVGSRSESLSSNYYSSYAQPAALGHGGTYDVSFTEPGIWSYQNLASSERPIYGIVFVR